MTKKRFPKIFFIIAMLTGFFIEPAVSNSAGSVFINEIAWMGTVANDSDEWFELYNSSASEVDLSDWKLFEKGGDTLIINLFGKIPAGGYYLIERTDDNTISDVAADLFGSFGKSYGLNDGGEFIVLKDAAGGLADSIDAATSGWPAGDKTSRSTMERMSDGTWKTNDGITRNGHDAKGNPVNGTPKTPNSSGLAALEATSTPSATPTFSQSSGGGSGIILSTTTPQIAVKAIAGSDIVAEIGQQVLLNGSSSQGASFYKWYLGDGSVKEGAEITHSYKFPGTYLITLEVSNGEEISLDQIKANIFGGKVLINEFSLSPLDGEGQWLELYNPNANSVDLAGWNLESGSGKFVFPSFVVIPKGGFLVLSNSTTGLDFQQSKNIKLKYPNGLIIDEVVFNEIINGAVAARAGNGFSWTREATPGRPNIVVSSGGALGDIAAVMPNKVIAKKENPADNFIASFYNVVANESANVNRADVSQAVSTQNGFWPWLAGKFLFWIILAIASGMFVGIFYVKFNKK